MQIRMCKIVACFIVSSYYNLRPLVKMIKKNSLKSTRALDLVLDEVAGNPFTKLKCWFSKEKNKACQEQMILALEEFITTDCAAKIISKLVQKDSNELTETERKTVYQRTIKMYLEECTGKLIPRRQDIKDRLLKYFQENQMLILEGFISFRLQDYLGDLNRYVEETINNYLLEKEYREFVCLLRYFVDIQEPKIDLINVFCSPWEKPLITDQNGVALTENYMEETLQALMDKELDGEDILISNLIALAPGEIVIHAPGKEKVAEVVQSIFGQRVKICRGCQMCQKYCNIERPDLPRH